MILTIDSTELIIAAILIFYLIVAGMTLWASVLFGDFVIKKIIIFFKNYGWLK